MTKKEIEANLKKAMNDADFQTEKSAEYQWLQSVYDKKRLTLPYIKKVCEELSKAIGKEYGSECQNCRRRSSFWIHTHLNEIRDYLTKNETEIESPDGGKVKLTPPSA